MEGNTVFNGFYSKSSVTVSFFPPPSFPFPTFLFSTFQDENLIVFISVN